jgi:GT2 family glycosyltransferase
MTDCKIFILTFKGKHHLELLLPTVRESIANYRGKGQIDVMIVDNGRDEATREFSQTHFPEFHFEYSPRNDYLFSLNGYIHRLDAEYVIILNDDMRMEKEVLNELIPMISRDSSLFAVTSKIMDWDGMYTASAVRTARYKRGWVYSYFLNPSETQTKYTLYPGGGAAIFRTSYFNQLNGFDPLFRPAYYEDADLGVRAWQEGWKTLYHPKAILYHREGGTINDQFKKNRLEQNIYHNQILWMIKNARYPGFLGWFFLLLPYRMILYFFNSRNHFKALIRSLVKIPSALLKRKEGSGRKNDKEWLIMLNQPYLDQSPI